MHVNDMFDGETQIKTRVGGYLISTVHIPAIFSLHELFETMVFDDDGDEVETYTTRYVNSVDAVSGHFSIVDKIKHL